MPILDWLNKDKAVITAQQVPYRLLEPVSELSVGDAHSGNMLIQGDNLEALKSLLPLYGGKVKCIYIDPPYNTENAFEHYDDNLEHSVWLSLLYPRLELLYELLSVDGFLCCHIDDSEGPYLKVILDEIFGRNNYQTTFYTQVRYDDKTLKEDMAYHKQIEYVHIYRKSYSGKPVKPKKETNFNKFKFQIKTTGLPFDTVTLGGKDVEIYKPEDYQILEQGEGSVDGLKEIWASGSILDGNSSGRFFRDYLTGRTVEDGLGALYKVPNIGDDAADFRFFTGPKRDGATKGKYFQGVPISKLEMTEKEVPIPNFYNFADNFGNCRSEGGVDFRSGKKPEEFLKLILSRFSSEGDLVLDSFLGSGSTAATALKMRRKFIGVEIGEQAKTHCQKRLSNVVDGDKTGISKAENWQGGSGFTFYRLGEPVFDEFGDIRDGVSFQAFARYLWFLETGSPLMSEPDSPLLGEHNGTAYYLLYNGILGDRRPQGGNVLTSPILSQLPPFDGPKLIFGESSRLGDARLEREHIQFRQIPYEVTSR